ncbi:Transcription initiation factor TFIID subunit 7 [Penicillium lagena]|uniref:Transcription initiation factor TFIID subunit 7 n=1 Tax=Penicillium lagena TaxID=94218 RepID=UPI00254042D7|nr:Transcription initiation factor TFIID subunit 7 [Penicillium lagena]KAJ5625416.1 Transcription initiation factor TFIID subunit 7 [Penicillium lagena]
MSDAPRPALKLKLGKKKAPEPSPAPAEPSPAPSETPQRKLTLKIARKPQPEPEEPKPKKKKPSKKRAAENAEQPPPAPSVQGPKRLKLNPSKKPGLQSIRIKNKGVVPNRPVGVGYDSEASDTEIDPAIEEQFILRMLPGEDCDYLRQAINERKFDKSEFAFKPLTREGRRAILKIRDKQYAAALVDLPNIIEGMKSWDRRGWYKSADICQMLLVLGTVSSDQEALEFPLPPEVERSDEITLQYPHGLAPPLRWVRKRRFRDRVSTRTIQQAENAVEDLIAQDEHSIFPPRFELVDNTSLNRVEGLGQAEYEEYDDEQDAEGEEDMMDDLEDALAAEMEAALAAGDDEGATVPVPEHLAGTPSVKTAAEPPTDQAESSGDESDMSDEGGDEPEDDMDDDQLEEQRENQQQLEEIAELEALIRNETAQAQKVQNHILRNKMGRRIQELKKDLELKKVSIGMSGDADI